MRLTSVYIHVSTVVVVQLISCIQLFATLWTVTHQTSLPMGFPRQEYWSGLPFLLQGIFPMQGSNPDLLHCKQILYHLSHQQSPCLLILSTKYVSGIILSIDDNVVNLQMELIS